MKWPNCRTLTFLSGVRSNPGFEIFVQNVRGTKKLCPVNPKTHKTLLFFHFTINTMRPFSIFPSRSKHKVLCFWPSEQLMQRVTANYSQETLRFSRKKKKERERESENPSEEAARPAGFWTCALIQDFLMSSPLGRHVSWLTIQLAKCLTQRVSCSDEH